ncbi:MAG: nitroreductase [Methylophaga sp.]
MIKTLMQARHSTRAFLDKPVSAADIEDLLDTARLAPSGANTQPWQVAVLTGNAKQQLAEAIQQAFFNGVTSHPDYNYYPTQWQAPYTDRRRACGLQLYQSLQITRGDKAAQKAQWAANYRAFDAPVMLLFFMDGAMQTGSYLDFGLFLQTLMLAATEKGLATCPQAALAEYPDIVKTQLAYPADSQLICGLALGYEDAAAAVNQYRTERITVGEFTRFFT